MAGHLFIISGPAGVGKTALLERLRKRLPDLAGVITYTARPPRPGEQNGVHYHFVSEGQFKDMIAQDAFLEWALVHKQLYGTPKLDVMDKLNSGVNIALVIDVQGAAAVKKALPETVLIFIEPDHVETLIKHLQTRRYMDEAEKRLRMADASKEMTARDRYDHRVVNREGQLDETVEAVAKIIQDLT